MEDGAKISWYKRLIRKLCLTEMKLSCNGFPPTISSEAAMKWVFEMEPKNGGEKPISFHFKKTYPILPNGVPTLEIVTRVPVPGYSYVHTVDIRLVGRM
eukprot:3825453-Rhodomonas_salina.1